MNGHCALQSAWLYITLFTSAWHSAADEHGHPCNQHAKTISIVLLMHFFKESLLTPALLCGRLLPSDLRSATVLDPLQLQMLVHSGKQGQHAKGAKRF